MKVYLYNRVLKPKNLEENPNPEKLSDYFWNNFCDYFKKAAKYLGWNKVLHRSIDCANGVGGKIMPNFNDNLKDYFSIDLFNVTADHLLNDCCGADFVKTNKKFPSEYKSAEHNSFLSFDGDADRIVFQ